MDEEPKSKKSRVYYEVKKPADVPMEDIDLVERKWFSSSGQKPEDTCSTKHFKVMQFNVLADALAHDSFIKCPKPALQWTHRGPLMIKEILRAGADIVCLEEVDHYEDFLKPELSSHGYDGFFFPKRDSPCLHFPGNNGPDGCAMFYLSAKFDLLKKREIILKNLEGGESHQVALLAEFKMKKQVQDDEEQPSVFVAMAHFKAKSEGRLLRGVQGKHLIEETSTFSGPGQTVIIAGDFNATAEEEVYDYFSNAGAHPDLNLRSSYKCPHYGDKEPPFTSWKFRAKGEAKYAIDYIWYTPEKLGVDRVWGIPSEAEIGECGLPCMKYPSDHVALCSQFSFV